MHKGHLTARITLHGVSAHSGYPHLGKNAIEAAARILVSMRKLRHRFEAAGGPNVEHFPEVPFVPLNVGVIHGGSATNVVPDRCVIELGARALPGMNEKGIFAAIQEAVANAAGPTPFEVEWTGNSPPMLLAADAPVHCELCALVGQTGDASVSFATDAGWFARAGLDCVIFGPGSIEVAHKPNEYVPKADLVMARHRLEEVVDQWCR
ncbi:MAG: M20/M25/M40 family metallo-hydrolase, partial [Planctomycetota bacterium]|nr:M20/M25/M40 family metallo-hydrolase [Planctomycetota bacterium]